LRRVWCITLYVSDLKESSRFYGDVLGLDKKYEYPSYIGFDCGGVEIGLIQREKPDIGGDSPTIEFLVNDVDEAYKTLKGKGVRFVREPHDEPWGGRQATFTDPDGNVLEILQIDWRRYFKVASEGA